MSEVVVYGFPQSTYVRTALMCLIEKGVAHRLEAANPGDGANRERPHPFGKVPAFSHGDVDLYETSAIARYIDAAFEGPALIPEDTKAAARTWSNGSAHTAPASIPR